MRAVVVGGQAFTFRTSTRGGSCQAHAVRADTGDRFGPDFTGTTVEDASRAATAWLEWQHAHATALAALQEAERIYHRSVADHAFGRRGEDEAHLRARRESLQQVEIARTRLDEVRGRRPA